MGAVVAAVAVAGAASFSSFSSFFSLVFSSNLTTGAATVFGRSAAAAVKRDRPLPRAPQAEAEADAGFVEVCDPSPLDDR